MRLDPTTKAYVVRYTGEGQGLGDAQRCLKRNHLLPQAQIADFAAVVDELLAGVSAAAGAFLVFTVVGADRPFLSLNIRARAAGWRSRLSGFRPVPAGVSNCEITQKAVDDYDQVDLGSFSV
ncbi:hypothetical protein ABZ800_22295 [Streptomyces sp. NPDC047813]|uniref:hypothetical protein n=1 Tax=Streptomyces sp. NPDC047813 TaxID=3154608 RepID=UPI0033EA01EF